MARHLTGIGFAAASALLLWGCKPANEGSPAASSGDEIADEGGGGAPVPNSVVHKTGSGMVEATLGPSGGTLELSEGAKVEIPPGAVKGSETYVLEKAQMTTAFYNEEAERPVGPTFTFGPAVEAPEGRSIRVSIPLASYPEGWGEVAIAYEYPVGNRVGAEDSTHTRWQYENAKLTGGRAVAELPALNGFRLQFVLTNLEAQ